MRAFPRSSFVCQVLGLVLLGLGGLAHAQLPGDSIGILLAPRLDEDARHSYAVHCDPHGFLHILRKEAFPAVDECELVVARVVAVHDEGATHAEPSTVLLQVEEVLTGDITPGVVQAVWSEHLHLMCEVGEEEGIRRWKATSQRGPEVGARFLLAGGFNRSRRWFMTVPELRLPFTPERHRALLAQVKQEQREWTRQYKEAVASRRAEARAAVRDDELLAAVAEKDVVRVRSLLREGVRPVAHTGSGTPALHVAASLGTVEVIRALLEAGALVETKEPEVLLRTALGLAADEGKVEAVELLLAHGANPSLLSWPHTPVLLRPAMSGHCAVVKALLARGAQARQSDQHGSTPLEVAARSGHLACVIALLEAGAEPNQANNFGWRPVDYAIEHPAVLEQLLRAGANPHAHDPEGGTPLKRARDRRLTDSVRLLEEAGATQ
ncbi:ankyrin repeat domain-containing protein [Archangium violaceum]|uniref:ankyrin repeat domain-containing protein n=1 Tax=Archangium violaceum TaxID=83451 RepID=UPI00194F1A26|nr:ankyrin repeat domain-containing protein [Archangium violaceum]QRN99340.1 ankyrin repeat domain-containing protein [Archangium violaceum]